MHSHLHVLIFILYSLLHLFGSSTLPRCVLHEKGNMLCLSVSLQHSDAPSMKKVMQEPSCSQGILGATVLNSNHPRGRGEGRAVRVKRSMVYQYCEMLQFEYSYFKYLNCFKILNFLSIKLLQCSKKFGILEQFRFPNQRTNR